MDKRDPFEQKIKEKLEGMASPTPDLDQAWASFSPNIQPKPAPFWKQWYMPYLFAGALFVLSLWWHQREQSGDVQVENFSQLDSVVDTVFVRDTVYVVDTIYLVKKVYVQETQLVSTTARENDQSLILSPKSKDEQTLANLVLEPEKSEGSDSDSSKIGDKLNLSVEKAVPSNTASEITLPFNSTLEKSSNESTKGLDSVAQKSTSIFQTDSIAPNRPRSMAAPSIGPKEKVVLKSDVELVVGDTSNLSNPPLKLKKKPMVHVEAVTSIMFPISRLVEYYTPNQNGIQVGLEWESGWGIYAGAIRNQVEGELDDEEIMQLSPAVISSLPNLTADISSFDEIYFTNRQWFFPLEIRWRSLYYSGFSFESSFGLMGNFLSRQDFIYEFENNFVEEYQYETVDNNQFSISHLRLGIGTNYLMSKRMGLFLRSHYWFPTARPGIIRDRMHGLEVGVGVNVFIGK